MARSSTAEIEDAYQNNLRLSEPLAELNAVDLNPEVSEVTATENPQRPNAPTSPGTGADTCSICLDTLQNLAVCDPCFHSFCYPCINAWSRVNNICPLCKSTFDKIHYDIRSNRDYKIQNVAPVNRLMTDELPPMISSIGPPPFLNPTWYFSRRRTTQHPLFSLNDTPGPSSSSFISTPLDNSGQNGSVRITTHRGLSPNISISLGSFSNGPTVLEHNPNFAPVNQSSATRNSTILYSNGRTSTISQSIYDAINSVGAGSSAAVDMSTNNVPDMLRGIAPTNRKLLFTQGRKLIYHHGFKVRHYNSNLTRDISLSFMQQRQASITRIMQWAQRELGVLLDSRELSPTMGTLMRLLRTVDINSRDFYTGLVGKLGSRTSHFIHELKSFAKSPFTVEEYDRHALYGSPGVEKIAIEITNEDIENWSCDNLMGDSSSSCSSSVVNNFAPSTSSATCALAAIGPGPSLKQNTKPPLILLSDDDENDINVAPRSISTTTTSTSRTASTSRATSSTNSKMKSNRSVSTYSARVISSEDEEMDAVFSRIKSVVNEVSKGRDRKRRRLSPATAAAPPPPSLTPRMEDQRMEVSNCGGETLEASAEQGSFPSTSATLLELTKMEPDTMESSVLTLDANVREISQEEYEESKPGCSTSTGNFSTSIPAVEVGNSIGINAEDVKIEDCQRIETKIEVDNETKQEPKTEQMDFISTKVDATSAGHDSTIVLDDSGMHCPTAISTANMHGEPRTIEDSAQSVAGNSGGLDEILALTDDLRPKAIVPDMSTPAAAEINIATTGFPIEVSESEEDAIVFIRQQIFTPPLVELPSGSDTENFPPNGSPTLKRPQSMIPTVASTAEDQPGPSSSSAVFCNIPPKSLRRYSSTSSDDSNDSMRHRRAKKVLLKRRPKRKRHVWERYHRRQKRKSSSEFRSDATSDAATSPKKQKVSLMDADLDIRPVPDNLKPGSLPRMLDQLLEDSDNAAEQRNQSSNLVDHVTDDPQISTPQLFDEILSFSAGGYSSDSEGSDSDSFNSRNRYHPYI